MMTLGEMLIDARKKAGRSALDVAHATRIMLPAVQAMEDDQLESLPAAGYVRGFILSYCRYVGCDPQPFLEQYERQSGHARHGHESLGTAPIDTTADRHRGNEHEMPWRVVIVVVAVIVLLGVLVYVAAGLFRPKNTTPPLPADLQASATATTGGASGDASGTASGSAQGQDGQDGQDAQGEPFDFSVKAKSGKASKVTITVDGVEAYKGSLTGDEPQKFEHVYEAQLVIKKPKNVTVTQNGTNIPIPSDGKLTLKKEQ